MIKFFKKRMERDSEEGFTLIELMVVVLIIAILIAIAIPTFLGARQRAQERAAQSSLRNAVTAAKVIFTDSEDYADATQAALTAAEPALTFYALDTAPDLELGPNTISFVSASVGGATNDNRFAAAARSNSGNCWFIQDIVGPAGTANAGTTWNMTESAGTNCKASNIPAFDADTWEASPGDVG